MKIKKLIVVSIIFVIGLLIAGCGKKADIKTTVEVSENTNNQVDFRFNSEKDENEGITCDAEGITYDAEGITCDACNGSGVIHCEEQVCFVCDGTGKQPCPRCDGVMWEEDKRSGIACLHCAGTGTQECLACDGSGRWSAWDEMCRGCNGIGSITDNPENKCPECGQIVEGELWYHVLLTHKGGEICQKCGEAQDDLELHTVRAHWDPAYYEFTYVKCPICNATTKFALEAHMKMHKDVQVCEICGEYYPHNGFEEHYLSAHNNLDLPQCTVCGNHIYGDLEQHMAQSHANMQKCKHCEEFVSSDQVDFHNSTAHSEIYAPECPICHVHVIGNSLEGHINQVHSHMVKCPVCGVYVGTTLEDHNQKNH